MAVKDKARVRKRLSALFPKAVGLTNERLDALAAKLNATDESTDEEIDTELTERNDNGFMTFEEMKVEDDRIRVEMAKLKKPAAPKKTVDQEEEEEEVETSNPTLTKLEKQLAELAQKLADKEEKEARQTLANRFKSDERLKGIPAWMVDPVVPKSEEEFETAVETLSENYKQFATDNKLEAFGNDMPTSSTARRKAGEVKEASKEEATDLASKLLRGFAK